MSADTAGIGFGTGCGRVGHIRFKDIQVTYENQQIHSSSESINIGFVIGSIVGCLCIVLLVVFLFCWLRPDKEDKHFEQKANGEKVEQSSHLQLKSEEPGSIGYTACSTEK